jgi:hypothetical protein
MSEYKSNLEKKIDAQLDKLFGDKDPQLRIILKAMLMNKESSAETNELISQLQEENRTEAQVWEEELVCTLDEKGNVVPIKQPAEEVPHRLPVGKT